jgi:cell wall-associated NlpC family hydrolase
VPVVRPFRGVAAPFLAFFGLCVGALGTGAVLLGAAGSVLGLGGPDTPGAVPGIPAAMLTLYEEAAGPCPGLSWTVLAAIGTVESSNGSSDLPGVHAGANSAGAEGPMQFEPATFARYAQPVPSGGADPPSPYDPTDAIYAAARMLCANGAADGANLAGAVFSYNHSDAYVSEVLGLAGTYAQEAQKQTQAAEDTAGVVALHWALAQLGTPYVWGGETPGFGFDCSGLVQAAYKVAGIALPRVAQEQFDRGPPVTPGTPLEPGDLVFFGTSTTDVEHVGLYAGTEDGRAVMVDAPHQGADVRVEPFPDTPGAAWGAELYIGATRPAA